MAIYFLFGLSLRTIEITLKSAFKCLIACLAFETFKDKDGQRDKPSAILDIQKIHDVTSRVKFVSLKEHIGKMCNVKNWICMSALLT